MKTSELNDLNSQALDGGRASCKYTPRPVSVTYNNWRDVEVPSPEAFVPSLPVSIIVPYYERPEELARTLASLERQTYPRDLFEVIVVDDGSRPPLERPEGTPLDIKVVHQEDRGYGLARARNNGARAAAHDILLILDCDVLVEPGWVSGHARWHHVVEDAVTIGFHYHVPIDGVTAETIRNLSGSLKELFPGRDITPPWIERHMVRTDELTSTADDIFRVVLGGNMGVGRKFYEFVGGFDETFTQWGGEDTEFGYRAYACGGLLVPARDAVGWHQGAWMDEREAKERSIERQRGKLAHQIAHPGFRQQDPGRSFGVAAFVVTIVAADAPVERITEAIGTVLADTVYDLMVFVDMPREHEDFEIVEHQLGSDPRVVVGSSGGALESFPTASFHVTIPAVVSFQPGVVERLHKRLKDAVLGTVVCDDGMHVSICRTWALHRAGRTGKEVAAFGTVEEISPDVLGLRGGQPGRPTGSMPGVRRSRMAANLRRRLRGSRMAADLKRLTAEVKRVRSPRQAWLLFRAVVVAVRWRLSSRRQSAYAPSATHPPAAATEGHESADYSLGAEIVALGQRSRAVFQASGRVAHALGEQHADVVLADTSAEASGADCPTVVLAEAPAQYSVPAFDPWADNPINPASNAEIVAALGPSGVLPRGVDVDRTVSRIDRAALKQVHRLEDVHWYHRDVLSRAGALARIAANGVVVRIADGDSRLEQPLGPELFELMTRDSRTLDEGAHEFLSIRMRRAALRDHSLRSRAQQICGAVLPDPPLPPLVSILMATRRPHFLPQAIDGVVRQTYPRLELVLVLHGDGFEACGPLLDRLSCPVKVLPIDAACPFGEALNEAVRASSGSLLSKMDDDDLYDADHIWDLVLAHDYSRASLVGKGAEYIYLAHSNSTVRRFSGGAETFRNTVAGSAMLIARAEIDRVGGWQPIPRSVDQALIQDVVKAGGRVYRTHGCGYVAVRHGSGHTWTVDDDYFLNAANTQSAGWDPALADFKAEVRPPVSDT
ncbi:MAG: glycosyltransferase [Rhodospirillales bacterium]|nr:glycosyltransferase [Rhodospirillales bacterium]MDE0381220.1 glycosyltransferase [Rhodospirillales bacterium]